MVLRLRGAIPPCGGFFKAVHGEDVAGRVLVCMLPSEVQRGALAVHVEVWGVQLCRQLRER